MGPRLEPRNYRKGSPTATVTQITVFKNVYVYVCIDGPIVIWKKIVYLYIKDDTKVLNNCSKAYILRG